MTLSKSIVTLMLAAAGAATWALCGGGGVQPPRVAVRVPGGGDPAPAGSAAAQGAAGRDLDDSRQQRTDSRDSSAAAAVVSAEDPVRSGGASAPGIESDPRTGSLSRRAQTGSPVSIPLAFSDAKSGAASKPEAASRVNDLQQTFADAVRAGGNLDPASPDYYRQWLHLKGLADERYRLLVGDEAFLQAEMRANGAK